MTGPTIGSLCSGYGGLDLGVMAAIGGRLAWCSDIDKGANKILAHRHPEIPNLGDFTSRDWTTVEPVDVLAAGFPCQPVSNAGKRLGDLDERWLWDDVARAVRDLRPGLVVLENVRGLLTARGGRLFGRVLGSLAELGYDVRWHGLRAADVGAPHGRFRVFIVATDTRSETRLVGSGLREDVAAGNGRRLATRSDRPALLPTPTRRDHKGHNQRRDASCLTGALFPTPAVNDMGAGKTVDEWDLWTDRMREKHGNGNGHGKSLAIEAQRLLPTPTCITDAVVRQSGRWGAYSEAVARWTPLIGRHAPDPTMLSTKGNPQLAPRFVEWMMGLPDGWVTDVPDLSRREALKALGNGVVPQQACAAVAMLLDIDAEQTAS